MDYELQPFGRRKQSDSPPIEVGKEAIRLVVSQVRYQNNLVELAFHASFKIPDAVAERYHDLSRALVLVVTDVDNCDGFSVRAKDDFIKYPAGEGPPELNLKAPLPLPLAPSGDPSGSVHTGGYLNGAFSFEPKAPPIHRPSVFLYLVLESFVSNSVGLDLIGERAITY
jgi:hypothetical protein